MVLRVDPLMLMNSTGVTGDVVEVGVAPRDAMTVCSPAYSRGNGVSDTEAFAGSGLQPINWQVGPFL